MWLDADVIDDVVFIATDLSLTPENVEHFVKLGVAVVEAEPLDACRPSTRPAPTSTSVW